MEFPFLVWFSVYTPLSPSKFNVCVHMLQGVGGSVQLPRGYLKGVYKAIRERGGVCISDEVKVHLCNGLGTFPPFRDGAHTHIHVQHNIHVHV